MVYEFLLALGVAFFGFLVPNVALGIGAEILLPRGILFLQFLFVNAVYFVWFWRRHGQTLAMRTWKIRLQDSGGGPPAMDQLLLRFILMWPSVFCAGAGLLWAVFDRDRQFLHDRLSGTRLVYTG